MLYSVCPTCGYFLAQKILMYEKEKQSICENPELSVEEQENEISKLIQSLNLRRYCCRMRVMSYKDIVLDIIPNVQKES